MILSLRFNNYYSFAKEAEIDFTLGKQPAESGYDIQLDGQRVNKVIAVVGANGSGKTQFIKSLAFISWFIGESFLGVDPDSDILCFPHCLNWEDDSAFELDFVIGQTTYRYQLTLRKRRVIREAMLVKTTSRFSYLFKRERDTEGDAFTFQQKGFPFPASKARTLRDNASLIAAAHSYDIEEAYPFIEYFASFTSNITYQGRRHFQVGVLKETAAWYERKPDIKARMIEVMREFDLGLTDIEIIKLQPQDGPVTYTTIGHHQTQTGQAFELPFTEESSGTQSAFVMLFRILGALQMGSMAIIDEIDNDLHPHLIPKILDWFRFEHTNPKQAQMIFTCHTPEVLNLLQKHQVYLCEKQDQCSEAWRLDQVAGLRADDNLYAKYMAGALGGVPDV